jgi:thiol-disulfide isomerase/thioredoxin
MKITFAFIIILLITLSGCEKGSQLENIIVSGKITNPKNDKIYFRYNQESDSVLLDADGFFKLTLKVDSPTFAKFYHGNEFGSLFLLPGDSIKMTLDANSFDESLDYSDNENGYNKYLAYVANQTWKLVPSTYDSTEIYGKPPETFLPWLDSMISPLKAELKKMTPSNMYFNQTMSHEIICHYYKWLTIYWGNYHYQYAPKTYGNHQELIELIDTSDLELNNPAWLKNDLHTEVIGRILPSYSSLYYQDSILRKYYRGLKQGWNWAYIDAVLTNIENREVQEHFIYKKLSSGVSLDYKSSDSLVTWFDSWAIDSSYTNKLNKQYNLWMTLSAGNKAPVIEGYDTLGNLVRSSDFIGNYIYVDVWAAWCGPCRNEMPDFEKLKKKYSDEKVTFMSVSVDADEDRWRSMLIDSNMTGYQLSAVGKLDRQLSSDYNIQGIPRYILIDPAGNIINADADRPTGSIDEVLFKLLEKK